MGTSRRQILAGATVALGPPIAGCVSGPDEIIIAATRIVGLEFEDFWELRIDVQSELVERDHYPARVENPAIEFGDAEEDLVYELPLLPVELIGEEPISVSEVGSEYDEIELAEANETEEWEHEGGFSVWLDDEGDILWHNPEKRVALHFERLPHWIIFSAEDIRGEVAFTGYEYAGPDPPQRVVETAMWDRTEFEPGRPPVSL